jgi:Rod binding domain-containing protein
MISDVGIISRMNHSDPGRALDKVCKEFETLFANQLLKTMAESVPEGFLEEGLADDIYKDMFYQEIARNIGESGSLGVADVLKRHIQQHFGEDGKTQQGVVHRVSTDDR